MYDPNDDTDVTSGPSDGAKMETTSPDVGDGEEVMLAGCVLPLRL